MPVEGPRISEQARRRYESEEQRLDRNLVELLQGLRVVLPGIQVLFAFLLLLPFQLGFDDVTSFERAVYFATLLLTAASSVCLMAPTARHRLRFRRLDKKWIVESSHRLTIVGLAFLGTAMTGVILLISHYLYDELVAALVTTGVAGVVAWVWFLAPLRRQLGKP
jgi:hypothetical protein